MSDETLTNVPSGDGLGPEGTQKVPPMPPSPFGSQNLSGHTLAGYKLVRKIAEGGMGVVYEAIQTKLDRKVALKVLTEQLGGRPEFLQRFEREAKAAAALSHPNMVQVYDYGESEHRHYIIMEYIEGENLASYVENHGKLSVDDALGVVEQAAQALKAAADKSIIHRDIKPSNLLLTMDGRVKVADLGLAKILSEESELTLSSVGIGSPHFIAPEQADDSRRADHRADIYSLGVTLLYLLTGKNAYDGASPISIVLAHTKKPLPSGAELGTPLPKEVEALINQMAAKDPNDRYQDYQSLILDLNRVRTGLAPTAVVGKTSARKSQLTLVFTAVGCVAVAVGVTMFAMKSKIPPAVQKTNVVAQGQPQVSSQPNDSGPPEDRRYRPQGLGNDEGPRLGQEGGPNGRGRLFDGIRLPMGPPAHKEWYDIAPGTPEAMLAAADDYAAKHPDNFDEILDCYAQVEQKAGGTTVGAQVAERSREVSRRHEVALKEAMETREKKMREFLAVGKLDEAYKSWQDFPAGLRNREADAKIHDLLQKNFPPDYNPPMEGRGPGQ